MSAESYAASLRQQACWIIRGRHTDLDESELCAAADFIERQQAEIETLTLILRHQPRGAVVMNAFAIVRALLRTKRAIVKELRQLQELHVLDRKLDYLLHRQTQMEERIMASFDDLKAAQDVTDALIGKVKTDVETLTALIAAIPPAGMTPEQQAALDAAATHAAAINDSLSAVDAVTADPAAPAPVEPAPTEPTA